MTDRRDLRCPFCGGRVRVHAVKNEAPAVVCAELGCHATWDKVGRFDGPMSMKVVPGEVYHLPVDAETRFRQYARAAVLGQLDERLGLAWSLFERVLTAAPTEAGNGTRNGDRHG